MIIDQKDLKIKKLKIEVTLLNINKNNKTIILIIINKILNKNKINNKTYHQKTINNWIYKKKLKKKNNKIKK